MEHDFVGSGIYIDDEGNEVRESFSDETRWVIYQSLGIRDEAWLRSIGASIMIIPAKHVIVKDAGFIEGYAGKTGGRGYRQSDTIAGQVSMIVSWREVFVILVGPVDVAKQKMMVDGTPLLMVLSSKRDRGKCSNNTLPEIRILIGIAFTHQLIVILTSIFITMLMEDRCVL